MSNINNIESGFIDHASLKAHETTINPEVKSELHSRGTYIDDIYVHKDSGNSEQQFFQQSQQSSKLQPPNIDLNKQSNFNKILSNKK